MVSTSARKLSSAMKEYPNWLEMPHDLMSNIFQRLDSAEILNSARKVCTTWLNISKDPAMWKVIQMNRPPNASDDLDLETLTKEAVDLSCGELIDICIEGFGTDDLLEYHVLRSSKLKCLSLKNCYNMRSSGLVRALKNVPQLEKLQISDFIGIRGDDVEAIGRNCHQLKSFTMNKFYTGPWKCDDQAFAIANTMPQLTHLELSDHEMMEDGLEAIVNGCPHLQSLDVRSCDSLFVYGSLRKLCKERIKDFKYDSHAHDTFEGRSWEEIEGYYESLEHDTFEGRSYSWEEIEGYYGSLYYM